ncbi:uncharacterized protein [Dermacentor albipictus]|uniref:uncharacterized protein isoform X2 n=1 Tax=Dermacentor albipictus TaxID=60249 RepID=UPI0038FC9A0C
MERTSAVALASGLLQQDKLSRNCDSLGNGSHHSGRYPAPGRGEDGRRHEDLHRHGGRRWTDPQGEHRSLQEAAFPTADSRGRGKGEHRDHRPGPCNILPSGAVSISGSQDGRPCRRNRLCSSGAGCRYGDDIEQPKHRDARRRQGRCARLSSLAADVHLPQPVAHRVAGQEGRFPRLRRYCGHRGLPRALRWRFVSRVSLATAAWPQAAFTDEVHGCKLQDTYSSDMDVGASATLNDIKWICRVSKLPVVVKGVLTARQPMKDGCLTWFCGKSCSNVRPEAALQAYRHGAAAVIESNHGGRQLDGTPATIDVLPEIVAAVGDKMEVYLDSGVRTGADVVKALALGARAVFVGRPVLWGLAYDGKQGVDRVLHIFREELECTMRLLAAQGAGTVMILSSFSTVALEDVRAAAPGCLLWQQTYIFRNRSITESLVKRAAARGFAAIVVTADSPVPGDGVCHLAYLAQLPHGLSFANMQAAFTDELQGCKLQDTYSTDMDALVSATLNDIEWLRGLSKLPVVVKGVLTAEAALQAYSHGAAAVIVSNHGGRQLDGTPATIDVLPEIVAAVGDKMEVYLDSGVRTGADVVKALALGARAVFVGRPVLWGLAYDVVRILRTCAKNSSSRRITVRDHFDLPYKRVRHDCRA